jgi:hypothetical protein
MNTNEIKKNELEFSIRRTEKNFAYKNIQGVNHLLFLI